MDVFLIFDTQCVEFMRIIADELKKLEANEFSMLLNKEKHADIKKELFAKPHQDILTDAHPVLRSLKISASASTGWLHSQSSKLGCYWDFIPRKNF